MSDTATVSTAHIFNFRAHAAAAQAPRLAVAMSDGDAATLSEALDAADHAYGTSQRPSGPIQYVPLDVLTRIVARFRDRPATTAAQTDAQAALILAVHVLRMLIRRDAVQETRAKAAPTGQSA